MDATGDKKNRQKTKKKTFSVCSAIPEGLKTDGYPAWWNICHLAISDEMYPSTHDHSTLWTQPLPPCLYYFLLYRYTPRTSSIDICLNVAHSTKPRRASSPKWSSLAFIGQLMLSGILWNNSFCHFKWPLCLHSLSGQVRYTNSQISHRNCQTHVSRTQVIQQCCDCVQDKNHMPRLIHFYSNKWCCTDRIPNVISSEVLDCFD